MENVQLSVIHYNDTEFRERQIQTVEECLPDLNQPGVTWINIEGIHQTETIEKLGSCFGLHPLLLEDILDTDQRPKVEDFEKCLFVVLRMIYRNNGQGAIINEQVSMILGSNYVISLQEGREGDVFNSIRDQLRTVKGKIRKMGADYLIYALIDAVVDSYFGILEHLGEQIETAEETVTADPNPLTLQTIHRLRQDMIDLRRTLWPLREVINLLQRGETTLITPAILIYLKDVYDHTIQVIETVETYRDMLTSMLEIYLSSISNRTNEVMKVLTIIATLFIPLTYIVGIYGMNFEAMPELKWRWGYPLIWIVMIVVAMLMLLFFRKRKWI